MKHILFILVCLTILVACNSKPTQPTHTPVLEVSKTTPILPTTTYTPVPNTHTPTPENTVTTILVPTLLPTLTASATPLPTNTITVPLPIGYIIFVWSDDTFDPLSIRHSNLYLASPGPVVDQWEVQPILNDLVMGQIELSLDETMLAFNLWEDTDGNGEVSSRSSNDINNLYVYNLNNLSLNRVTANSHSTFGFSWLGDNQTLIYDQLGNFQGSDLFTVQINDLLANQLFFDWSTSSEVHTYLYYPVSSLNQEIFAANLKMGVMLPEGGLSVISDTLAILNVENGTLLPINNNVYIPSNKQWSPTGQWLASNIRGIHGLFLIRPDLSESLNLVEPEYSSSFAWSPDGQQLVFTISTSNDMAPRSGTLPSQLLFWDLQSSSPVVVTQATHLFRPVWSSDTLSVAVGFLQDTEGGLFVIDTASYDVQEIVHLENVKRLYPIDWSPDNQWLLFFSEQEDSAGLYIVHRNEGKPYLLQDTTGTFEPFKAFWLQTNSPTS